MLETVFEFLFKYRPVVFERGELVFATPWPFAFVAIAGALAVVGTVVLYARARTETRDKFTLAGMRLAAIAVIVFSLAGPALVIATVVPQENFIGVLIDDSESMQITDVAGASRGARAAEIVGADAPLLRELADRFKVRVYRFSEIVERVTDPASLTFEGRRTDIGQALSQVQRELSSVPLAGLVVLSDGGENTSSQLTDPLLQLQAAGVPVHTVGLGEPSFERDIEVVRVETPRAVLTGSIVAAELTIRYVGFGGETIEVQVESNGAIVSTREVRLPRDGNTITVRAHFTTEEHGPQRFRFVIPSHDGEMIDENNVREALIVVEDRREKILYFEGEPRFEVKFLRRAVADDENVHVVTLQRTAENKYLRLDVEDSTELAAGFPRTREELFRYRGLILGSVEASFFTHDQLQMIADFVSVRGGGLLTLGGRRAFAEGGYTETPVADALPVVLAPRQRGDTARFFREVHVSLTPFGRTHAVTQLRASPQASEARWDSLPSLSILNPIREVKPGASTLLMGEGRGGPYVVMAYQRYGRGKSIAFPVQDSWVWQMDASIPLEDLTHENLWRQLLRWLVSGVATHVIATTSDDRAEVGHEVEVTAEVSDSGYLRLNGADVTATIITPSGEERAVPMEWTVERDGEYRVAFTPEMEGLYEVRVAARQGDVPLGEARSFVQAGDVHAEFFGAEMREPLLRRIADETGGHFYTPETVSTLPEDVSFTESGATVYEQRDLWDMPFLLFLLVGLLGGEWVYRRARGLP